VARGFAGETAEQEARGPGPSAEAVSAAEGNAIGSAMSSAMGFGPNDGSDDEDFDQAGQQQLAALATRNKSGFAMGNPKFQLGGNYDPVTGKYSSKMAMNQFLNIANTRTKNLKEARSTLGRLQGVLGPGNALTQDLYNGIMGVSSKNPYGHGGVFSSFLGIDPKNIDYTQNMGIDGVAKVAQLKYDRYKDYAGQDPLSQKRGFGSLFAGPVGEVTSQGPVAQQVDINNIPIGDAIGAQAATFGLGPFGYGLMSIADPFSTYVPTGSAAYNSEFDPAVNKDLPSSVMGQAAARSGLGIESLVDKVTDFFSPEVAEPTAAPIGTTTSALSSWSAGRDAAKKQAFADAVSSVMRQAQTSPSIANMSLEDKKIAINELAERNFQPYLDAMPDIGATSFNNPLQPGFSRTRTETLPDGRTITMDEETGAVLGTNLFGGQQSSLQNTVAGEQLAGSLYDTLFRDPNISPEARGILKEKGMTIDDLFAPKVSPPVEEKPDIMDLIEKATQTSALGGSSTANQIATVDYTNLTNTGNNLYRSTPDQDLVDKAFEFLGIRDPARRSSGQIKGSTINSTPLFNFPEFKFSDYYPF
jgi:hypothetical protein